MLTTQIATVLERAQRIGVRAAMVEDEEAKGHLIVSTGTVPWLPLADWPEDVLVTLKGKSVRIILIHAREPYTGAFGRLITAIIKADLFPIVLSPMMQMPAILSRWGWSHRIVGSGFSGRQDEWFPSPAWIKARRQT